LYPVVAEQGWLSIFAGINSHPAVSALGHDFLLSAVSFLRWRTVSRSLLPSVSSSAAGSVGAGLADPAVAVKGGVVEQGNVQKVEQQQQKKNKGRK